MIPELREQFNRAFTREKYREFLADLDSRHPGKIDFRVAETPIFVPRDFTDRMISGCESVVDLILQPDFRALTDRAIPPGEHVPGEKGRPHFLTFDFGVCEMPDGSLEPRLIEMQAFPTLFGFQVYYPGVLEKHFHIPPGFSSYLGGFDRESYLRLLQEIIVGTHDPENVILLELKPHEQKTRIDFYCTQDYLHIPIVCLTDLVREGTRLYYVRNGKKIEVKRIYNRVIFDDLNKAKGTLGPVVDLTQPLDVEWVPHPNWFYRVSKFTLPFLHNPTVPETYFLSELKAFPSDLENFVLKPLFSFAGQGVIIDVTRKDLDQPDPSNWILQRKVRYADIIRTPDVPAKAEIRIFYFWQDGMERPVPVTNLARLSKGKMIGVRYNANREWVGGSVAYFEN